MLVNAKSEELAKYSKGVYDKEQFISKVSELWEWTDKQIRMLYLTADLAINGSGVFSVSNKSFREMFEKRFKMSISRSTVIRFFQLLEELKVLTVNEARRKNRTQSANIFIIEPCEILDEIPDETPDEILNDTLSETPNDTHNIAFNNAFNKDFNTPLTKPLNNLGNNLLTSKQEIIDKLILEYMQKGLSKEVCFMVLKEVEDNPDVQNFGGYFRTCLKNTLYKHNVKHGLIDPYEKMRAAHEKISLPFYNWLDDNSDNEGNAILGGNFHD